MNHLSIFSWIGSIIRGTEVFFARPLAFFCALFCFGLGIFFSVSASDVMSGKNIFQDSDSDGLTNEEERLYATDPFSTDTDGDGYSDGAEVKAGYDPLKKAPGDKIALGGSVDQDANTGGFVVTSKENLTKKVSAEVARLVKEKDIDGADISLDDMDAAIEMAIGGDVEEVVLPEVSNDEIKVKVLSKKEKKLSKEDRKEKEKEYIVDYLTTMSYIVMNNSPEPIQKEEDIRPLVSNITNQTISALSSRDSAYINNLSKSGESILGQIREVSVPESMVELHMKALRMAKYLANLKEEVQVNSQEDPLRGIAVLSKIQGLMSVVMTFMDEFDAALSEYGITDIPFQI